MQLSTSGPPKFGRVLFIDRSLASKRLPDMLRRMGFEVEIHKDYFIHDADDDQWIPVVSERNWVILSGDKRLLSEPPNNAALLAGKSQLVLVTDTNSLPEQWGAALILGRRRILELLEKHSGPMCIRIGKEAKDHINLQKEIFEVSQKKNASQPSVEIATGTKQETSETDIADEAKT